jgi:hypothetical protein
MRDGVPVVAEVRIARDRIEGLMLALNGRGVAARPDAYVARALSVRLRAPHGGFTIEAATHETQWVESPSGVLHDDHAIWRWTVTPQRRGRNRLLLTVSARTIGRDGLASESAPPDRVIDVRVRPNHARRFVRWSSLLFALLAGAALGRFSLDAVAAATETLKQFLR